MPDDNSLAQRIARLSQPQKDALRLVRQAKKSEQIAAELGISKSAVDKRIEGAMRHLGVSRREIAAMMLDQAEGGCDPLAADLDTVASLASLQQVPTLEAQPDGRPGQASGRTVYLSSRHRLEFMMIVALLALLIFGFAVVASNLFQGAIRVAPPAPIQD